MAGGIFDWFGSGGNGGFGGILGGFGDHVSQSMNNPMFQTGLQLMLAKKGQEGDAVNQGLQNWMLHRAFQTSREDKKRAEERDARDFKFRQDEAARQASQWGQSHAIQQAQSARAAETQRLAAEAAAREAATSPYMPVPGDPNGAIRYRPGGSADPEVVAKAAAAKKLSEPISAADKKAILSAEDELPAINATLAKLARAKELHDKTYTGFGSGVRTWAGTALKDGLVPDIVSDPKMAENTMEYNQLLNQEAIKEMSQTLKGASTDKEMGRYLSILADPNSTPKLRKTAIEYIEKKANQELEIAKARVNELRGGTYYKPGQGGAGTQAAQGGGAGPSVGTVDGGYRFKGGDPSNPSSWEKVQ